MVFFTFERELFIRQGNFFCKFVKAGSVAGSEAGFKKYRSLADVLPWRNGGEVDAVVAEHTAGYQYPVSFSEEFLRVKVVYGSPFNRTEIRWSDPEKGF